MMCQRIGLPPISTVGLGRTSVSSARREPSPPARMPTLIWITPEFSMLSPPRPAHGSGDTVPSCDLPRLQSYGVLRVHPTYEIRISIPQESWASEYPPMPLMLISRSGVVSNTKGKARRVVEQ